MTTEKMFYCETCAKFLSAEEYGRHDASHGAQAVEVKS